MREVQQGRGRAATEQSRADGESKAGVLGIRSGGPSRDAERLARLGFFGPWSEVGDNGPWFGGGGDSFVVGRYQSIQGMAWIMNKIKRTLDSTLLFIVAACFLLFEAVVNFWPASYWLQVDYVKAVSAKYGERIPMLVDRTIHRPFTGEWVVSVKRFVELGWVHHCHGSGKNLYKPGGKLPMDVDLEWWTAGGCKDLPPGNYIIETSWVIKPTFDFLPERQVSATSNIFEVTP